MSKRAVTVSGYVIFFLLYVCVRVHARVRAFSGQMKNQYIFRVIHIQCPQRFRPDGERVGGWGSQAGVCAGGG